MATINLTLNLQVAGGPKVLISKPKSVEAYDKIEVVVKPGATSKSVEIQPGATTQVNFLLIKSSVYSQADPDPTLTYKVNNGTEDDDFPAGSGIELDEPHLYLGRGAVSILEKDPNILKFTNNTGEQAAIEILVGRDATPDPTPEPTPEPTPTPEPEPEPTPIP
ncbi:MAG: hypothetical protein QNJ36_10825 [Calothrix sp. MO_167.B42]|nr:hypothetical protein [Calothrix sp. MO_167.B42]